MATARARDAQVLIVGGGPVGMGLAIELGLRGVQAILVERHLVARYYYSANERLPQYLTEAVLRQRASEIPSIQLRFGWTADDLNQDEAGVAVRIRHRDGTRQEVLHGEYLVGCSSPGPRARRGPMRRLSFSVRWARRPSHARDPSRMTSAERPLSEV